MSLTDDEAALVDFYRAMRPADRIAYAQIGRSMAEAAEAKGDGKPTSFKPNRPNE